jgi:hypothetical protein
VEHCGHGNREHLPEEELDKHIKETNLVLADQLRSKWHLFKDSNICHAEYMTYMINVICYMCDCFVGNMKSAMPDAPDLYHEANLVKAICGALELDVKDHRFQDIGTKH